MKYQPSFRVAFLASTSTDIMGMDLINRPFTDSDQEIEIFSVASNLLRKLARGEIYNVVVLPTIFDWAYKIKDEHDICPADYADDAIMSKIFCLLERIRLLRKDIPVVCYCASARSSATELSKMKIPCIDRSLVSSEDFPEELRQVLSK